MILAVSNAAGPAAWTAWCDGSAWPNPGRMGWGAVLVGPAGERRVLSDAGGAVIGCNNEAELRGVMAVLTELRALGAREALVHCDNSVVVAGLGRDAAPDGRPGAWLAALFDQARALLRSFDDVRVVWIPAHRNAEADALARAALGLAARPAVMSSRKRKRR